MSQKSQSEGGQKHFAVGRGLLAAAETLNFSMNEQRSSRQMGGMSSGVGVGGAGMEGHDGGSQMSRLGGGNHLGSTMKLFASLGLSPSDLDALAEIPEEDISVETLPHIIRQLKSRKGEVGDRRGASSMSSEATYQGGRDSWDQVPMGRMGGPSLGQGSARAQSSVDFGYSSLQDAPGRSYGLNYGGGGGGSRERPYSELSHHDSYGGLGLGPSSSDSIFMPRRVGPPPHRKVQDFLGVMPPVFPHLCSLCDFDVRSIMEWNQHTDGLRHAENRRLLLDMYPEWDPGMSSSRGGGLLETPNLSAGLLGAAPMSSGQTSGGMSSGWGGGPGLSGNNQQGQNKLRSRVVVVKYDRKPLSTKTLFAFTEPFGVLREHLVLKNKAFFEMNSHEEALDMVSYYELHPASLYGKPLTFYLSKRLLVIEKDERASDRAMDRPAREVKGYGSQVVFFSNLPREEEKKMELLTIAARFGIVEKHLFLTDQAFVQLGTPEDAEMLVKYYSVNPLTIKGRSIRLNICTKYKTLNVNRRQGGGSAGDGRGQRSSSRGNTSSFSSSSSAPGTRTSSGSLRNSSSSKSSSRSRDERKKEEEKPAAEEEQEEEEEEVSGVMEGEEEGGEAGEEQVTDGDAEGEEPETAETVEEKEAESEEAKQEEVPGADDVTEDKPEEVGGAEGEPEQGAESEPQTEPTEEPENKEEPSAEPGESSETMDESADTLDQDFLENMEDFVTLDELAEDDDEAHGESDSIDNSRRGGMRVVNVVGFRRGYNFLNELLGLAKPFGKVVKHLVLDLKPEAYLQFDTEEEARAMAKFYSNSNVTASVCGRPVRISHSMSYPTIQCGSSKVVYIGQIPSSKYSDDAILTLAEPYGRVRKYFLNRIKRECFIEMEKAEDAEKMAEDCKTNAPKFNGKRLTVYVSRKYRQLKYGHRCPTAAKRESSPRSPKSSKHLDEPPTKKSREERKPEEEEEEEEEVEKEEKMEEQMEEKREEEKREEETQSSGVDEKRDENSEEKTPELSDQNQKISSDEVKQEEEEAISINQNGEAEAPPQSAASLPPPPQTPVCEEETETSANQNGQTEAAPPPQTKPSVASLPLPPHDPETPIGVEHVKMGYYCRVCFLFYSNEDMAKKTHCSSPAHYDKLQKHLEKERSKAEKKKVKKTPL
ncbi:matrin 3-like 1.2 isoform X2 [Notolabrus celidotus]|uniref:matrin 3-like 1.2 isoform X2 n=1 Tax=Notolabrus celidotus TaxID=1203425 RepID=UPI00148F4F85|nr:matrin 3-like 1.2 isoform X2 [Notolabrus celidotus]